MNYVLVFRSNQLQLSDSRSQHAIFANIKKEERIKLDAFEPYFDAEPLAELGFSMEESVSRPFPFRLIVLNHGRSLGVSLDI